MNTSINNKSVEESFPPLQQKQKPGFKSILQNHNQSHHTHFNASVNGSYRDDQVHDLMSSIQNKLSMLVCEDSYEGQDFEISKINSPKKEYLTATDEKRNNRAKITLQDLDTSHYLGKEKKKNFAQDEETSKKGESYLGESRVLNRINEMQDFYLAKIQQLSSKIANIEFDYEELQKKNSKTERENKLLKQKIEAFELRDLDQIDRKVEQVKKELIIKFSDQSQKHFEEHMKEMKQLNEELSGERAKRRYLEKQIELVKNQRKNLEQFYRNLLTDHRNMIKIDLERARSHHKDDISSENGTKTNKQTKSPFSPGTKKKTKRKSKRESNSDEMSKEEMIPFLAKGIQDLKEKLRLK